ncbi:hypothetical protein BDD21_4048 [Thiocapsa rosea]|uniref:Uncharacterized protein n=1 Tax=Thiocapsa rosea TaxID=69360 RepID=A0A495VAZ7_9GAMM|nr:hypothetical protein BDD21_4048 [Thiocapsa rosea]
MSVTGLPHPRSLIPRFADEGATPRAMCRILGVAEQVQGQDPPGKDLALSRCFHELLCGPDLPPGEVRRFRQLRGLIGELPGDNQSTVGAWVRFLPLPARRRLGLNRLWTSSMTAAGPPAFLW